MTAGRAKRQPEPESLFVSSDGLSLAARLRLARETLRHTQKEMASRLGLAFRSLQDYEAGNAIPGGKALHAYGNLGIDLNWVLLGKGNRPTDPDDKSGLANVPIPWLQDRRLSQWMQPPLDGLALMAPVSLLRSAHYDLENRLDDNSLAAIMWPNAAYAPLLPAQSILIADIAKTKVTSEGGIFLVLHEQGPVIYSIGFVIGGVTLCRYGDETRLGEEIIRNQDDLEIIGRVLVTVSPQ